jgi:predicted nucleic acid-binding protein
MKLVISDSTTLITLAKTNHLDLLSNFIEKIYIPVAVKNELSHKEDGVKEAIEQADFIETRVVSDKTILNEVKKANLDLGEIQAISLALETGFDLIIDERLGRKYAKSKNINIMGLLGILKVNLVNGFITHIELLYLLEEFKQAKFRLNPKLEKSFLESISDYKN